MIMSGLWSGGDLLWMAQHKKPHEKSFLFFRDSLLGVPTVRVHVPSRVFAKAGRYECSGEGHPAHPVSPAAGLSSLPAAGRAPGEGPSLHAPRIWMD